MPPFRKPTLITLRRHDLSHPWGFRLAGGSNLGQPFQFQKVIPDSIAHKNGLKEGDLLARIGNITLKGLTHEEVQEIIMRCNYTIDLFIIRNTESETESPGIQSPTQQNFVNAGYPYSSFGSGTHPKSLTEQVLNRMIEEKDHYFPSDLENYANPLSPPNETQTFVKERQMYEYNEYSSPSKSPQSPIQRPPPSGRPFSPVSPTNISYHQPEEQQWMSSQEQSRDPRVFGSARTKSPTPGSSPVPQRMEGQKDTRVFGVAKPRGQSPFMNGSRPNTASSSTPSPVNDGTPRDVRGSGGTSPSSSAQQIKTKNINEEKPMIRSNSLQEKQFFGAVKQQHKSPEDYRNQQIKPPVNNRRIFVWKQRMGTSLDDSHRDWKESLPQLKTVHPEVNQLLPSHIKREQTYIVQTPPTEKNARPPPTGTIRRRIRPVWPPPDWTGHPVQRSGFNRGESPSRKCEWPPSREGSVDRDNESGIMSPRMRYSTPPPNWNPMSGSDGGRRSSSRRARNTNWPPPSNATPAGPTRFKSDCVQSLPSSRRESQTMDSSDFYVYIMNHRIPQTYRAPPDSQYYEQSYHYDTD